jgi:hypothetical protein
MLIVMFFLGTKRLWHKAEHSLGSSTGIKNGWSHSPFSPYVFMPFAELRMDISAFFLFTESLNNLNLFLVIKYTQLNKKQKLFSQAGCV